MQALPDGRIGAHLVIRNSAAGEVDATDFTVYVEADGRRLIDDVVFLEPAVIGTPTTRSGWPYARLRWRGLKQFGAKSPLRA